MKLPGVISLRKALADLRDAEGHLFAGGALDVHEVDEDALRGLGAQVDFALGVLGDALEGLEHQVELADIGKVRAAAFGAGDAVLLDVVASSARWSSRRRSRRLASSISLSARWRVLQSLQSISGSEKPPTWPRRDPHLRVHQDGGIEPDVIGALLDELFPPGALDVVFEFHAERAVVPAVGKPSVDLRTRIDKAPAFAEVDDFLHRFFTVIQRDDILSYSYGSLKPYYIGIRAQNQGPRRGKRRRNCPPGRVRALLIERGQVEPVVAREQLLHDRDEPVAVAGALPLEVERHERVVQRQPAAAASPSPPGPEKERRTPS